MSDVSTCFYGPWSRIGCLWFDPDTGKMSLVRFGKLAPKKVKKITISMCLVWVLISKDGQYKLCGILVTELVQSLCYGSGWTCSFHRCQHERTKKWDKAWKSWKVCKHKFTKKRQSLQRMMKFTLKRHEVVFSPRQCATATAVHRRLYTDLARAVR